MNCPCSAGSMLSNSATAHDSRISPGAEPTSSRGTSRAGPCPRRGSTMRWVTRPAIGSTTTRASVPQGPSVQLTSAPIANRSSSGMGTLLGWGREGIDMTGRYPRARPAMPLAPGRRPIRRGSLAGFGLELVRLLLDRGEQRGPVRAERARSLALEAFGERVDVDPGVGDRGDGPFRRRVVRVEALIQRSVIGEGEQRRLRDGVDGGGGGQAAQIVGVGKLRVLGRGGCPQDPLRSGAGLGKYLPALV